MSFLLPFPNSLLLLLLLSSTNKANLICCTFISSSHLNKQCKSHLLSIHSSIPTPAKLIPNTSTIMPYHSGICKAMLYLFGLLHLIVMTELAFNWWDVFYHPEHLTHLDEVDLPKSTTSFCLWFFLTMLTLTMLLAYKFVRTPGRLMLFTMAFLLLIAGHGFYLWFLITRLLDRDTDDSGFDFMALLDEALFGILGSLALLALVIAGWTRLHYGWPIHPQVLKKEPKPILKNGTPSTFDVRSVIACPVPAYTNEIPGHC